LNRKAVQTTDTNRLIKGVRIGNCSVKIFQNSSLKYLVIIKRYKLGINYSTEEFIVEDYFIAEDYLNNLKLENNIYF
jgi:hypothetical protein